METVKKKTTAKATERKRLHNFSPGPATLPEEVLLEVREELPVYGDTGASVMEISHRSDAYDEIEEGARARLKKILGLSDDWHVLFLQGGASMQFHQVPLNFMSKDGSADYLNTGRWSMKAIREARMIGGVNEAASSEEDDYAYIPDPADWNLDPEAAYLHFTSNNTVNGTQFHFTPEADVPLVADASSDFLSKPIDTDPYGLIYAGAQKNIGPAGVTVVLVKDAFLEQRKQPLPTMLDYGTHAAKRFNTPPVFAIYVVGKVLRWIEDQGGLEAIEQRNDEKAKLLYERIDKNDFYRGTVESDSRSKMNVTYRIADTDLEPQFLEEAGQNGLLKLKGHRTVGGIRASIYNACPMESVEALVSFMDDFERTHG